ncbi:TRAP transporter substrate-binding protein [Pararhodobacter zhoushanensis]|uniref:TRAP transporter substrate-binding protein n=1 Tax=Pararhodobacter zhoushanensis TaxID=2479545 RepID=A0ABT3H512_9RHOB|nr:TRAP transporter substrate-binding protein [Pararhodobacter zhoushanensis]MCW1934897.1 TRAP transporter substrate-binding protein [Pararhodobacter zhoushanensis]
MHLSVSFTALAAAGMIVSAATPALADTLRFSHFLPPGHYFDNDVNAWGAALDEASGGELTVQVFPAGQMGAPADHYAMVRDGIVDVAWVNFGYTPGAFPIADLIDLPFSLEVPRDVASVAVNTWYAAYAGQEMSDVHFCLAHVGAPGALHSAQPITLPSDVAGLQVRPASGSMARFIADLGGSAVQVPATEARQAIERGVANAITFPWGSIDFFGISDAVPYHIADTLYYVGAGIVMNKARYEGLSPEMRAAVDSVCTSEWAVGVGASWVEFENNGRQVLADMGHTIHESTPEELAAWHEAAQPSYDRWAATMVAQGLDPQEIRASLDAAVDAAAAAQ